MTIPGDPGHVTGHNTLEESIRAQAARFGVTVTLTGPYSIGAPNHIGVHNLERQAILDIAAVAGITVTVPDTAELGELGHTSDHDLLSAAVAQLAAAPAWNNATGGTVTEIPNYNGTGERWRVHTFTTDGVLTIERATQPFRVLVQGGGGGGGGANNTSHGGGGNGGYGTDTTLTLTPGAHAVEVGTGGGYAFYEWESYPGSPSSISTLSAEGGLGGQVLCTTCYGANNGPTSDISGASVAYGQGGYPDALGGPDTPGSGGTGSNAVAPGQPGKPGIVIVAYQIGVS